MGFRCALLAGLLLFAANGFSGDISEEPFFKFLIGTWTGNGDLVNKDGEKTPIEEEWTAVFGQWGDFTMKEIVNGVTISKNFAGSFPLTLPVNFTSVSIGTREWRRSFVLRLH